MKTSWSDGTDRTRELSAAVRRSRRWAGCRATSPRWQAGGRRDPGSRLGRVGPNQPHTAGRGVLAATGGRHGQGAPFGSALRHPRGPVGAGGEVVAALGYACWRGLRCSLSRSKPYMKGDPRPLTEFFPRRDNVTLSNPLGPPRHGPADVDKAIAEGAAHLRDGSVRGFEEVARYSTPDLGYVVQLERTPARLPGSVIYTSRHRSQLLRWNRGRSCRGLSTLER